MDFRKKYKGDKPLVTIGVLSYNYAMYVIDTLYSIHKQTYPHIEFFIVDDCSTDNSVELIRNWIAEMGVKVTLIVHEVNKGRNIGINTILQKSSGKYVVLFASDDEMLPFRIEEQVKLFEDAGEEYGVCYSDAELMNEKGEYRGLYSQHVKSPLLNGYVFEEYYNARFFIAAPSVMFRKSIYDKVGVYDMRLTAEDYDMWMRILPVSKILYCPYVGVKYRIKENQNLAETHQYDLAQWYHKDRIIIYKKLVHLLDRLRRYPDIKTAATRKISYHLIQLNQLQSPYFKPMLRFLLKNYHYNIPVMRLAKFRIKHMLQKTNTGR